MPTIKILLDETEIPTSYNEYLRGELVDQEYPQEVLEAALKNLP